METSFLINHIGSTVHVSALAKHYFHLYTVYQQFQFLWSTRLADHDLCNYLIKRLKVRLGLPEGKEISRP